MINISQIIEVIKIGQISQKSKKNDKISPNNQCQIITNNHYQIIMK